uniref:Uncharacterized protein n=1 Tax=Magallana gigas TaxID=29159 RepID=K1RBU6_MAGGI
MCSTTSNNLDQGTGLKKQQKTRTSTTRKLAHSPGPVTNLFHIIGSSFDVLNNENNQFPQYQDVSFQPDEMVGEFGYNNTSTCSTSSFPVQPLINVLVNPATLRTAEMKALTAKNPAIYLLSKVLDLVFSEEELRNTKGARGLDKHKMDALKEYMFSKCQSLQIEHLRPIIFNTTIQNKIGNIRQKKSCVKGSTPGIFSRNQPTNVSAVRTPINGSGSVLKTQIQQILANQNEIIQQLNTVKKDVKEIKEWKKENWKPMNLFNTVKDAFLNGQQSNNLSWNCSKSLAAIKQYFTSQKEAANRQMKNKTEIHKKRQATYERKKEGHALHAASGCWLKAVGSVKNQEPPNVDPTHSWVLNED